MRVAIGMIFVSLLSVPGAVGVAIAADGVAGYSKSSVGSGTGVVLNTSRDAINFSSDVAGATQSKNAQFKDANANDDRRLASLDPSQIVYSQAQGYASNYSQGFSQAPLAQASLLDLNNSRLFPRQDLRPAALHHARSLEDFLLMGFVAVMLIVYQLRKKHRFLRPHPFSY